MNYIIFDLEATCWKERSFDFPNETIEIGTIKINEKKEVVSEFVQFIKPLKHPVLSDFCKELTSIRQEDVDGAPHFLEAIGRFQEWIGEDYLLCSWGFYDRKQFKNDCELYGLETKWLKAHISLKHQYARICDLRRAIGMANALDREGLSLDGTHHRGIDDAKNIAKLFLRYFDDWKQK